MAQYIGIWIGDIEEYVSLMTAVKDAAEAEDEEAEDMALEKFNSASFDSFIDERYENTRFGSQLSTLLHANRAKLTPDEIGFLKTVCVLWDGGEEIIEVPRADADRLMLVHAITPATVSTLSGNYSGIETDELAGRIHRPSTEFPSSAELSDYLSQWGKAFAAAADRKAALICELSGV